MICNSLFRILNFPGRPNQNFIHTTSDVWQSILPKLDHSVNRYVFHNYCRQITAGYCTILPNYIDFNRAITEEEKDVIIKSMLVLNSFLTVNEEKCLLSEIEPYMRRLRYEFDHWDNAIHGFRETERLNWNKENTKIINRVRECAFPPTTPQLQHVHILDLAEEGYIKPHIDSVRRLRHVQSNQDKIHLRIHSHGTRQCNQINIPQNRLCLSDQDPLVVESKLWNRLPAQIEQLDFKLFKIRLQSFLTKKAFYHMTEFTNFACNFRFCLKSVVSNNEEVTICMKYKAAFKTFHSSFVKITTHQLIYAELSSKVFHFSQHWIFWGHMKDIQNKNCD